MRLKTGMKITKKTKIRHRNELNKTLSQLPLQAKRVVYLALAPIDSKNPIESGRIFRITASDLSNAAGISLTLAYQQLKEGAKLLKDSSLLLTGNDIVLLSKDLGLPYTEKNRPNEIDLSITDYCAYFHNSGYLEIRFSRSMEPYISNLVGEKNRYTTKLLSSAVKLSGMYSSSLYQLIRKNCLMKSAFVSFKIGINDLKDELLAYDINEDEEILYKYPEFPIFKREVLNKSIKEITKKTEIIDIKVSIAEKEGKKASVLLFECQINEEALNEIGKELIGDLNPGDVAFLNLLDEKGI
ncbi:replication initiation protein [Salmonella enterica]|nr:replication initiation protein [Salmonella enterica]EJB9345408.1 replication initiation protein [Salmonella enterica]